MSEFLILPIVGVAIYILYRHLKRELTGKGDGCCDCASRKQCQSGKASRDTV